MDNEKLYIAKDDNNNQLIIEEKHLKSDNIKDIINKLNESGFDLKSKYQIMKLIEIPLSNNRNYYQLVLTIDKKGGLTDNIFNVFFHLMKNNI